MDEKEDKQEDKKKFKQICLSPVLAGLVARGAVSLRLGEVVHVDVLRPRASDDLLPFDRLDVTQVVVVQDAHAALEDIWGGKRLRMMLGMGS